MAITPKESGKKPVLPPSTPNSKAPASAPSADPSAPPSPAISLQPSLQRNASTSQSKQTRDDATKEFAFHPADKHKDGIKGLYVERGLDPDDLKRSMRREFEENHQAGWLKEYKYVVDEKSIEEYPSSKGDAPNPSSIAEYTREWMRTGLTLDDFVSRQPVELAKIDKELNRADVASLRLYTGPVFAAWNGWLRGVPYIESPDQEAIPTSLLAMSGDELTGWLQANNWATSVAILNNAVLKLSRGTLPNVVFRGVKEDVHKLPDSFLPDAFLDEMRGADALKAGGRRKIGSRRYSRLAEQLREAEPVTKFAGGVEKAFMSTSEEPATAFKYSGPLNTPGAIFQIRFDVARSMSLFPSETPPRQGHS